MSVKTVAVVLGVVLVAAVTACQPAADNASSSGSTSGTAASSAPAPAAVPTTAKPRTTARAVAPKPTTPKATATTPTATRTTPKPAPKPVALSTCGAPANPWGYNFCARGSYIYAPAGGVCAYFDCIGNFDNGVGYMVQCNDGMYSMSGGRRGACSYHSGEGRAVYSGAGPH